MAQRRRIRAAPPTAGVAAVAALALFACRDAPAPFDSDDRTSPTLRTVRLTFSAGDEHAPAWLPDGSRIVYSTRGFSPYPEIDGLLLSVGIDGGTATPILPEVQLNTLNPGNLTAPSVRPDGMALAYLRLTSVIAQATCSAEVGLDCDAPVGAVAPMLRRAQLTIRDPGVPGPASEDRTLDLLPVGFISDASRPVGGAGTPTRVFRDTPFQRVFRELGVAAVGPSWAPSGNRLVFGDGSRLYVWAPGGEPEPLPGTEWANDPAWSPDGAWIAFSREAPTDSSLARCTQSAAFGVFCALEITSYTTPPPTIEVVRPDGSQGRVLVEGIEPAWSNDSQRLFYASDLGIRSIGVDGAGDAEIPATGGGREPAPSPDGRWLAFTRVGPGGSFDLWRTELTP